MFCEPKRTMLIVSSWDVRARSRSATFGELSQQVPPASPATRDMSQSDPTVCTSRLPESHLDI
eukprot:1217643-Pyramimonas_sp.AAC.1